MLVLKLSFMVVTCVKNIRVSRFTASGLGIPVHLEKQSKVTGQKKQLRLDLTGVHIRTRARARNNRD